MRRLGLCLVAVAAVGCSGSGSSSSSSSSSSSGAVTSSSAAGTSHATSTGTSGTSTTHSSTGGASSASGNASSRAASSSSGPTYCGGIIGQTCSATEYCDYFDLQCGAADGQGTCTTRPQDCVGEPPRKTCACDGTIYPTQCDAFAAGFYRSTYCTPPAGTHACGDTYCDDATQYCRNTVGGAVGLPPRWECSALPASCNGTATCACLANESCATSCTAAGGVVVVQCQAP